MDFFLIIISFSKKRKKKFFKKKIKNLIYFIEIKYTKLVLRNTLGWPEQHLLDEKTLTEVEPPHKPRTRVRLF